MKTSLKITFLISFLLVVFLGYSQGVPPPDGGSGPGSVDDVGSPINFLVYPFLLIGAYFGYIFFKRPFK